MKKFISIPVVFVTMLIFSVGNAKENNDYIALASSMNDIKKSEINLAIDIKDGF